MSSKPQDNADQNLLARLEAENLQLKERLKRKDEEVLADFLKDMQKQKERSKSLEAQLHEVTTKCEELSEEQDSLIERISEENKLRKKLKEGSNMIEQLLEKL